MKKGRFNISIKIPNGSFVKWLVTIDIPVIPPSIMLLGIKNISSPIDAKAEPNIIKNTLLIVAKTLWYFFLI